MTTYYDLRNANRRVDSFSDQVVAKLNVAMPNRQGILRLSVGRAFMCRVTVITVTKLCHGYLPAWRLRIGFPAVRAPGLLR